ncbi:MAG TPA: transcription antitermination factor NusB [Thermoanaerobaculia bacterium]|jgi:16S rRNA (cytosine967-C5)-methyltransferase|nr:transcription antitermination factor NusB [Thermoanaerobaculia bacterium]
MTERQRALHLLQRIERENLYASLVLIGESGFIRTLVLGVLRWRSRLDFAIAALAKRAIGQLDTAVIEVLRLGLYQLLYMDVPAYAAVSETVDLAPKRARGFVNAILRSATRSKPPEPNDLPTRTAHPQWLIDRWTRMYGAERTAKIAEANQELSYPDVLSMHGAIPPDAIPSTLVQDMYKLHGSSAELDRREFHPMDEGSAVIAAVARAAGDDILDVAAAPGGKAIYMSTHGARVIANDISIARLQSLRDLRRVVSDGRTPSFARKFEVVLLDAPCSATGTIRKSPELKWRLRETDLPQFAALQKTLLDSAMTIANKYVIYSTCSLEPEENDAIVEGRKLVDITEFVPEGTRQWVEDGVLRLTPESGADGFTAFALVVE